MKNGSPVIDVQIEYCRKCGSCLDSNKRCTGCGKQYFHIKKGILLKLYAVGITLFLAATLFQNNWNIKNTYRWIDLYNAAQGQIDEINKTLEDSHISEEALFRQVGRIYSFSKDEWIENPAPMYDSLTVPEIVETLISSYFKQKDEIGHWFDEIIELEKINEQLETDFSYLSTHAVFVTETGTKYHKYDCHHLSNSNGFWIFNVEAAKSRGYTACADCWEEPRFGN